MAKAPSIETQLRTARTQLRQQADEHARVSQLCAEYRTRAAKAEQEVAEWKRRFDALLHRDEKAAK